MASLGSLPPELLKEVAIKLDTNENKILRLVCRYISEIVEPLCLQKLCIDIRPNMQGDTMEKLKAIAARSARNNAHIQELEIYSSEIATSIDDGPPRVRGTDVPFSSHVFNALMALESVPKLLWWTCASDDTFVQAVILEYIDKRRLVDISLDFHGGCNASLPFRILAVDNLEAFRVKNVFHLGEEGASFMTLSLSRIICNSPNLTSLDIDTGFLIASIEAPSLHRLLSAEIERPPMPLKRLALRNVRTLLDEDVLYHLRSLESLSIHFNLTTRTHGSHLNEIWDTLRVEAVHLSAIDLNLTEVDDALLDYLMSYDGIREVNFDNSARLWTNPSETNAVAVRFFKEVLPKIAPSLEILHLVTTSEGAWCFDAGNASVISRCINLQKLTVSIVDMIQSHSQPTMELLNQTVTKLPKLYHLKKINVATVPQFG